jgi:uncharacterized repeat protein (TIGR01451 family)
MTPLDLKPWLTRTALFSAVAALTLAGAGCEAETDDDEIIVDPDEEVGLTVPGGATVGFASAQEIEAQTVTAGDELVIAKTFPETIMAGREFKYVVTVANETDGDLSGVRVTEELPEGFEFISAEPAQDELKDGHTEGRGMAVFRMGTLPAGEARQITITGVARSAGDLQACTTYDFERGVCVPLAVVNPNIEITRMAPEVIGVCEPGEIVYTVTNSGETVAEDVTLYEMLPEGLMAEGADREVSFEMGDLQPGQSLEQRIVVLAEQPGEFPASYAIAKSELDEAQSERSAIRVIAPELDLQVMADSDYGLVGDTARFRVTVTNEGESPAYNTAVGVDADGIGEIARIGAGEFGDPEAQLAAGEMGDGDSAGLRIGDLAAGESRSFFVEVDTVEPGDISLAAVARSVCARTELAIAEDTGVAELVIVGAPALQLEVIDSVDPVAVGGETIYEIQLLNEGTGNDQNVVITAALPEGLSFVEGDGDSAITANGQTLTFAPVQTIEPGQVLSWFVKAKADSQFNGRLTLKLNTELLKSELTEQEPTRGL